MAANPIQLLTSNGVTLNTNSRIITLNDNANASFVFSGSLIYINGLAIGEAISGTSAVNNISTITLRNDYQGPNITNGFLIAQNTLEGLANALYRIETSVDSIGNLGQIPTTARGLLNKTGDSTYTTETISSFVMGFLNSQNTEEASQNLGFTDLTDLAGAGGVLRKTPSDVYSVIQSTSFGESLLTQNNSSEARTFLDITDPSVFGENLIQASSASNARSVLGVNSATTTAEGLVRQATQSEAESGTNSEAVMTPQNVAQHLRRFGYGANGAVSGGTFQNFNNYTNDGKYYLLGGGENEPPGDNSLNGQWWSLDVDAFTNWNVQKAISIRNIAEAGRSFFRILSPGLTEFDDWIEHFTTYNLADAQNVSGGTVAPNGTVSGASLNPAKTGTWRNISGNDITNDGYGLFKRV